ncbi:GIY-YIG nuclease family protein [Nocardioides lacusdianchii]|uniref:GIY-YIG nuclease family protein n=1 Tax=Nocardioides lacusdianchii TaxID=2783664 RepID=UPI001CCF255F|nr:GIY-YIG nuclease family protein [Nocardioides lacusdianchii]
MSATHALYRFHSADGTLLYVGITADPGTRWRAHSHDKPWWHEVANVTVEQHPDRQAVLEAERAAIIAEQPRYNVVHNRGQLPLPTPAEQTFYSVWSEQAREMPDDCHDVCVAAGIEAIYFPHFWAHGTAHYLCEHGHAWTCGWGNDHVGAAPQHRGTPHLRLTGAAL